MSGGYFNYNNFYLEDIANQLKKILKYGKNRYSAKTLEYFKKAYKLLREAGSYVNRIDYFLSGDDGEENFHRRLAEELNALGSEKDPEINLAKCENCNYFRRGECQSWVDYDTTFFKKDASQCCGYTMKEGLEE